MGLHTSILLALFYLMGKYAKLSILWFYVPTMQKYSAILHDLGPPSEKTINIYVDLISGTNTS